MVRVDLENLHEVVRRLLVVAEDEVVLTGVEIDHDADSVVIVRAQGHRRTQQLQGV